MAGFVEVICVLCVIVKQAHGLVYPNRSVFNYIGMIPQNRELSPSPTLFISSTHPVNASVHAPFLSDLPLSEFTVNGGTTEKLVLDTNLSMPVKSSISRRAFLLQSTHSVSALLMNIATSNLDAVQLMELSDLGREYVIISFSENLPGSYFGIASPFECEVSIKLPSKVAAVTVTTSEGPILIDRDTKLRLHPYEALQVQSVTDLTGTTITSNNSIAVFAGHNRTTNRGTCLDHLFSQMPKTSDLGTEHIVFSFNFGTGRDTIRVVSSQNDTTVEATGKSTLQLPKVNTFRDLFFVRKTFNYIRSSKPVMIGCIARSNDADPSMWVFTPLPFSCSSYSFVVPYVKDLIYHLVLVIHDSKTGGIRLNGQAVTPQWTTIAGAPYKGCYLVVKSGISPQTVSHRDHVPFAAYVLAFCQCMSYAFRLVACERRVQTTDVTKYPCSNHDTPCAKLFLKRNLKTRFVADQSESYVTDDVIGCLSACRQNCNCVGFNFAANSSNLTRNCQVLLSSQGTLSTSQQWDAYTTY